MFLGKSKDPLPIRFPKEHKRLRVGQTAFDREVLDCIDELLHLGQYMIKQQSCAISCYKVFRSS